MDTNETGGHGMPEQCTHLKDFEDFDRRLRAVEEKTAKQDVTQAETKIYMTNVLDGQNDIKNSIKDIQKEIKDLSSDHAANMALVQSVEAIRKSLTAPERGSKEWNNKLQMELISLAKWAVLIVGALVGVKLV